MLTCEVERQCKWDDIEHLLLSGFAIRTQVVEEAVFGGQCLMSANVIHYLFISVAAYALEVDSLRHWFPLKVV